MGRAGKSVALTRADASACIRRFGYSPRTAGVPVLAPDAPDEAWLAARARGLGASETAAVLGLSPHSSAFSLWWNKAGAFEVEQDTAMKVGSRLEPVIGDLFAEDHPDVLVFRPGARLWRHPTHEWMLATPDFFVVRGVWDRPEDPEAEAGAGERPDRVVLEPLECKSDEGGAWGAPGTDEVPPHHLVQVLQQMAVLDARRGHLMRLAGKRPTSYLVTWTEANLRLFHRMVRAGQAFMATVESGVAPDIDGHEATTEVLMAKNPTVKKGLEVMVTDELASEYRAAAAALANARAAKRRVDNALRERMENAEFAIDEAGRRLVQRRVYPRRGYEVAPCTIDSLNPVAGYDRKDAEQ